MKHLKYLLLAVLTVFAVSACSQNKVKTTMEKKKVLVVYFSATGTTRQVAKQIAKIADADICEIAPAKPYSSAVLQIILTFAMSLGNDFLISVIIIGN